MPSAGKSLYLTFDDGPHPTITPWVLGELKKYNARATFFCIGNNVERYPDVYRQILTDGHAVGNHTYSHKNGWKTPTADYLADVKRAVPLIDSGLFRPPYGRIRKAEAKKLAETMGREKVKIVMWDVLSADFDPTLTPEACAGIVLKHAEPGSVIVFHDSEKAFPRLRHTLPVVLEKFENAGFTFRTL